MIDTDVDTPDAALEKPPTSSRTGKPATTNPALANDVPLPEPESPCKPANTFRFGQTILVLVLISCAGALAWLALLRANPENDARPTASSEALDNITQVATNEATATTTPDSVTPEAVATQAEGTTASRGDNSNVTTVNVAEVAITDLQGTRRVEAKVTSSSTSEGSITGQNTSANITEDNSPQLGWGTVGFAAPENMMLGKLEEVTLKISRSMPIAALKDVLQSQFNDSTDIVIMQSDVRLSNRMQAILTGASFSITQITPDIQAVSPEHATTWSWQIEANKTGEQKIFLTLVALIDVEGKDTAHAVETFRKEVRVNVTAGYQLRAFAGDNWQWLWAVIVAPAGLAFWRYVKSPNRNPG